MDTSFVKRNWYGGINQLTDRSKVDFASEYALLVNGRVRNNNVTPVTGPLDITAGLPTAAAPQGIYGVGKFLLVFAGGLAYYRDYTSPSTAWNSVLGFTMSPTAPKIYAEAIPASTVNFERKAVSDDDLKAGMKLSGNRNSSPQAIICMDGVSQPWLIFPDGTARVTKNFNEWSTDDAEYVPIAKYPFYYNGVLYCIGQDTTGTFNQIFRSVTGRPCDFLIIVNAAGNKTGTEQERGAPALAERVDYDEVTYIGAINSDDGTFLVTTAQNSYAVTPDYQNTIAAEPTFIKQYLFGIGSINDESVTDVLGDTVVIHGRGIRSFNGVQQLKFEGKYSPFNLRINRMLEGIIQTATAATTWENYAVFSINTVYGYGLLWYDMLLDRWVSLDLYDNVDAAAQFAAVTVGTVNKLFMRTVSGRIYELFAGERERCVVHLADLLPTEDGKLHSLSAVYATFSYSSTSGYAEVACIVDGEYVNSMANALPAQAVAPTGGVLPVSGQLVIDTPSTQPLTFLTSRYDFLGARISTVISWNTDAQLLQTTVVTSVQGPRTKNYDPTLSAAPIKIILLGSDANLTSSSEALNVLIKKENANYVLGLGSHTFDGTANDIALRLRPHWNAIHALGTFYAVPGPAELDTSIGEPFFQYVRQYPSRYSKFVTPYATFFLFNAGFDSSGTQVEPDNLDGPTLAASTQASWLATQAGAANTQFKFVLLGTPPLSSAGVGQSSLAAIPFAANGIDAVFSGLGNYERIEATDRVVYVNAGTGGNVATPFGTSLSTSAIRLSTLGYVRLTLLPLSALIEFVDSNGDVLDRRLL